MRFTRGAALVILSLLAICVLTLRPAHASSAPIDSHLCLVCGGLGGVDVLLNTLLFIPLGVGLSLIGWSFRKAFLTCFALSLAIETAQLFIAHGRDATLSDLLTNTLGGAIGFSIARAAPTWVSPSRKTARLLTALWAVVWLSIQFTSNYVFSPSLTTAEYHGHIARERGGFTMFHGQVDSARIGAVPLPEGTFADSPSIRQSLLTGAPIVAVVRMTEPTSNFASIVGVGDDRQREMVLLAEQGDALMFSIRSGASKLRLRQPLFALRGVFATAPSATDSAANPLTLSGRFTHGTVQLAAQNRSSHRELNLSPRAALAWTVVLPFQSYLENRGVERAAAFLCTAVLLIPLGYWAAASARQSRNAVSFALVLALVAILVAGFVLVPAAFALTHATALDWIAALLGVAAGAAIALALSPRLARSL